MQRGQIVLSKAGRDKGHYMVVLAAENTRCTVADGKQRRIEHPKQKNQKHLCQTNIILAEEDLLTNRKVKAKLRECNKLDDSERRHFNV